MPWRMRISTNFCWICMRNKTKKAGLADANGLV
jgi:hypothetical protein